MKNFTFFIFSVFLLNRNTGNSIKRFITINKAFHLPDFSVSTENLKACINESLNFRGFGVILKLPCRNQSIVIGGSFVVGTKFKNRVEISSQSHYFKSRLLHF